MTDVAILKAYCDTSFGQVHYRAAPARKKDKHPPLLLLHPAPSSGLYFTTAMPLLNRNRRVIAPDYPGYGGSDPLSKPPKIKTYAKAMNELASTIASGPVDILGFHTGCLVAAEMALSNGVDVRRLVLCDIPYFTGHMQDGLRDKMAKPMAIGSKVTSLQAPWAFNIESRIDVVPLERAFELFAEHLRAGANDYFGFAAAFSYDCEKAFRKIDADVVILATRSGLLEATRTATSVIPGARLVEVPEVTTAVFEQGAEKISDRILAALDD